MPGWAMTKLWPGLNRLRNREAGLAPEFESHVRFLQEVDASGFDWMVFVVAASGFLTDSYNLFASNVILPALDFVYWRGPSSTLPFIFNLVTLIASALGQVAFGTFADVYGRKSLYGIELVMVILSTIGLLQCSKGYSGPDGHTWNFNAWLFFWRIIMGFAIGAEYPLSACIAAEWSSTRSRGRIMSSVFLMQPIGQLCAYLAGLTALSAFPGGTNVAIDKFWRYVIGIGAIPTLIAISFRLVMPESGRYEFDVLKSQHATSDADSNEGVLDEITSHSGRLAVTKGVWHQFHPQELREYFSGDVQRWRTFVGVCTTWFLLDIAFYGLGFNSPATLAKLWAWKPLSELPSESWWLINSDVQPNPKVIRTVLRQDILHAIYTISIASICGSILIIALVNRIFRRDFLIATFVALSALLFAAFGSFTYVFEKGSHDVLIFFWVVISFIFSFGPNTLTYLVPAEVFPTKYRCTFYGIAAASGKVGSVVGQSLVYAVEKRNPGPNSSSFRWLLLVFAICMLLGALFSVFLPDVQDRTGKRSERIKNLPLEFLSLTQQQQKRVWEEGMQPRNLIDARTMSDEEHEDQESNRD